MTAVSCFLMPKLSNISSLTLGKKVPILGQRSQITFGTALKIGGK